MQKSMPIERLDKRAPPDQIAADIDKISIAINDNRLGMSREEIADGGQRAGGIQIVRIEPAENFAGGLRKTLVDGVRLTAIRSGNPAKARVVFFEYIDGAVGRAAVHHQVLKIGIILPQNARDRRLNMRGMVKRRGDDGNGRQQHRDRAALPAAR